MNNEKIYTKEELKGFSVEQLGVLFDNLLRSTGRSNIENLITWLHTKTDFYTAPATLCGLGNYEGGLIYHSLSVYSVMKTLYEPLSRLDKGLNNDEFDDNSIILVSLLHDICLVHSFESVEKRRLINGVWHTVRSYDYHDQFPLGHGDKSIVFITMNGVFLTREEMLSIKWHGGKSNLSEVECPTYNNALRSSKLARMLVISVEMSKSFMEENREFEIKE
jgi:hypothetical protein